MQQIHGVFQSAHSTGSTNGLPSHQHGQTLLESGGSNKQLSALHQNAVAVARYDKTQEKQKGAAE